MWFKNLSIFRLTEDFTLSPEDLEQKLGAIWLFAPAAIMRNLLLAGLRRWEKLQNSWCIAANGFMMICGKKEEKVLPAAVVNEMVQEKILEAEDQQGRKLSKKERTAIKDELIFELLPRAFTFSNKTYAYIDPKGGWLIVDAASSKKAEDLLSLFA